MTTTVVTMQKLDAALARAVALEVEAKNWRIHSGQWRRKYEQAATDIADLKAQLQLANDTTTELMRMVDSLRGERDTWRAESGR